MALEMTSAQLNDFWEDHSEWRSFQRRVWRYYKGEHDIVGKEETYVDGSLKAERVTNWIKYAASLYTGTLTSTPWQLVSIEDGKGEEGNDFYSELSVKENLDAINSEVFLRAYLQGYCPELHTFRANPGEILINSGEPTEWLPLYDGQSGDLSGAINRIEIEAGTVWENEYRESGITFMTFFSESRIVVWRKGGEDSDEWILVADVAHFYGKVPVVFWQIDEGRDSQIDDAIIGQNDEYNEIDSASGDDIRMDTDSVLVMPGLDISWIQTNIETIRDLRVLPWPGSESGNMAPYYLTRGNSSQRVNEKLKRVREHLHVMLEVPDFESIVGATGITSGIALKLKFLPMILKSSRMMVHIRASLMRRVDLINAISSKIKGALIENVKPNIQFTLPVSRTEEWQAIGSRVGIVSHMKILELLTDVDDPVKEMERLQKEQALNSNVPSTPGDGAPLGDQQKAQQAQVVAGAENAGPAASAAIAAVESRALELLLAPGVLDSIIKQSGIPVS